MREIKNIFKVVSNEKISPAFYRLALSALDKPAAAAFNGVAPGQFVHIRVAEGLEPFFRRPFGVHRAGKYIEICYEVVGKGTEILKSKRKGDLLDVLGPLGHGYGLPPKGIEQVVLIAGGIAVSPLLMLTDALKKKGYELVLLYGARSSGQIFDMKQYKINGCKVYVSTNDGSVGVKGRVSELFEKIKKDPVRTYIYTCGPEPMMNAVKCFADENGINGQASLEAVMACGLGACLGCSKETSSGYKTVCGDGPVFYLKDLIFNKKGGEEEIYRHHCDRR